ncbi:rCG46611 [Rattus norvegicus]|uniref:RCG46611 n=1 Tax=Rattus norvegicus TaxID=10116 RepID=A6IX84_RAT|nr:rCG46611 [Rattus norvegicus]
MPMCSALPWRMRAAASRPSLNFVSLKHSASGLPNSHNLSFRERSHQKTTHPFGEGRGG